MMMNASATIEQLVHRSGAIGEYLLAISRSIVDNNPAEKQQAPLRILASSLAVPILLLVLTVVLYYNNRYAASCRLSTTNKQKKKTKPWIQVPGAIPILGHWHKIRTIREVVNVVEEWCDAYGGMQEDETSGGGGGVLEVNLAGQRVVVVCREDRLRELLPHRVPEKMTRPPEIRECAMAGGVTGLYAAEGDQWRLENRLVRACLNQHNLQDYLPAMKTVNQRLMEKWKNECETTDSIAVLEALALAASDALALIAMKQDFDSLHNPDSQVVRDLNTIVRGAVNRTISPIWYWRIPIVGQYLDGCGWAIRRMKKVCGDAVDAQEASFSQKAVPSKSKGDDDDNTGGPQEVDYSKTFLQKLLGLTASGKTKLERHRLTGSVMTLFFAGTDTTSKTTAHALYLLAQDPALQQTLRREVEAQFPGDSLYTKATLQDLYTKLPRLKSFVHELHRHYGSPCAFWYTIADIPFCGTILPKGTKLMIMKHYMSCNTLKPASEVPLGPHGEPPSAWCPERFLVRNNSDDDDDDRSLAPTPQPSTQGAAFGGFGHGLRMCPGRRYAETVTYLTLASTLQNFEWGLAPDRPATTKIILDLVQMPDQEIRLHLTKRHRMERLEV